MCLPRAGAAIGVAAVLAGSVAVTSHHLDEILLIAIIGESVFCLSVIAWIVSMAVRDHSPAHRQQHEREHWWHRRHQHEEEEPEDHMAEVIPFDRGKQAS